MKKSPQVASRHPTFARFPTSRCGFSFWNLSNSNASWHSLFRFRMWRPWGCRHTLVGSGVYVCVCVVLGGHSVYKTNDFVQQLKEEWGGVYHYYHFYCFKFPYSMFQVTSPTPQPRLNLTSPARIQNKFKRWFFHRLLMLISLKPTVDFANVNIKNNISKERWCAPNCEFHNCLFVLFLFSSKMSCSEF